MTRGGGGQASEAGIHGYDRGIVSTACSRSTPCWATDTVRHAPVGTVTLVQGGGGNNTLVVQGDTRAAPAGRCCCSATSQTTA